MKRLILIFLVSTLFRSAFSQNLVLNGDFAQMYSCPVALSMIDSAVSWSNATTNGTPDFFHQCANPFFAGVPVNQVGYQQPYSGEGYAGLYLWQGSNNYREFMQGTLSSTLIAGNCYHFEMFINLSNFMKFTASNIGVLFSDTMISGVIGSQMQAITPQISNPPGNYPDTANWIPVTGNYTANGGENFIIIGNYDTDNALDSLLVSPFALWPGTHVLIDNISLTLCTGLNDSETNHSVHIFPNPVQDLLHIETESNAITEIILYDCNLKKVKASQFTSKTVLDVSSLRPGMYFYRVLLEDGQVRSGKINKPVAIQH